MKNIFHFALSIAVMFPLFASAEEGSLSVTTQLKLFPEHHSQAVATINAGTRVTISQRSNDWCLIEADYMGSHIKGWTACANVTSQVAQRSQIAASAAQPAPVQTHYSTPARERRVSLAINPVTLLFPWIEVQIGIAMSPRARLNITPQFLTWAWGRDSFDGSVFGGTLSISALFDDYKGWYMEPGILFLRGSRGHGYLLGGQLIGGYEQVWDSGFFTNFGIGVGVAHFDDGSDDSDDFIDASGTYPYPTGNLHIGVKF